jgi:hypothetical protein
MKKLLIFVPMFALAVPLTMALAQQPNTSSSSNSDNSSGTANGPMQDHGKRMMMEEHHAWMKHHPWMHHPMGPPMLQSRAAFFHFQRGDSSMTIKCADDESTQACVSAAASLMQDMHNLQHSKANQ